MKTTYKALSETRRGLKKEFADLEYYLLMDTSKRIYVSSDITDECIPFVSDNKGAFLFDTITDAYNFKNEHELFNFSIIGSSRLNLI